MRKEGASAAGSERRIVVSGVGAVSGLGWGIEALWQGLREGRTAIRRFQRFDHSGHRTHLAAEVPPPPPDLERWSSSQAGAGRQWSVADRFALAAAAEAFAGAGLAADGALAEAGVFFGSSTGGMWESEGFLAALLAGRRRSIHCLASQQVNGPGDAVARFAGAGGPVQTISSACASGALAADAALQALRSGEVELAIAGGSDSLCQLTYAGFNALRSVDEQPCRPFRAGRAGMSLGEGAAVLVLEPAARALARGARPLAELAGSASSCDAHHMTAPHPRGEGAAAAMLAALADAGVGADAVDFLNAHGTGTPLNDAAEWHAMEEVFGERAARIPLVATKALVGHLLGSAGAIEAVATVLALARGELHPAWSEEGIGGDTADGDAVPALPVSLVVGKPLPVPEARVALSTSLAFGGSNAVLVFRRWSDPAA
ncbi:MAG TPA: beta-ketoacyl-[acyl-carrier-protein] synthase family protein [Thermoanaerobaculia bacterium]|nr:beta-ketoacyl-[acyl-carrier-protein] synthase family protein [Thermoanaerobaculia bacterium]